MIVELFPFQKKAVAELRARTSEALGSYRRTSIPQVVSLQAPTGAGKTIIMAALVEEIFFGNDIYEEQQDAIFVWLSDSPALNEQSKQKFELKADKIRINQCVTIEDETFDKEVLSDGTIYFLNTQKLSKSGNLSKHSDLRQFTIWETLEKTVREKSDRLYFIIDEAHRGMQGRKASEATTIMQRFLKGSEEYKLPPMPVVIGVSATAARFNALVGNTTSTLQKCIITASDVRASGLLKERIFITYPEDPEKQNELALLQAAADEWKNKCDHWEQYCREQHYAQVNPVFVIQVLAASGNAVSDTNLDDVIAAIEERIGIPFKENEVGHTFGSVSDLTAHGLTIPHIEPTEITEDRRVKVVLFKENLSTGWDCPRAETMMSFRKAQDTTYIAQLLGRMVRTPLQCHIKVDDYLNDVRLFLPHFNRDSVTSVIDEFKNTEGSEIPVDVEGDALGSGSYETYTIHSKSSRKEEVWEGQLTLDYDSNEQPIGQSQQQAVIETQAYIPTQYTNNSGIKPTNPFSFPPMGEEATRPVEQIRLSEIIDRENITKFINEQGLLTYVVRKTKINSYLKSLLSLASLLTQYNIYCDASKSVKGDVVALIREYNEQLHSQDRYDALASQVLEMKLSVSVFDVFGEAIEAGYDTNLIRTSESDLDRQLRRAEIRLGDYGFTNEYGRKYYNDDDPSEYKIDCILFAADDECIAKLNRYAEGKFHELHDNYRRYIVNQSEKCQKEYSSIVANGDAVSKHNFSLPETITVHRDDGGTAYKNHLLVGAESGVAFFKLNGWERGVLEEEEHRADFVCWIRNVSKSNWSLCVPYEIESEIRPMYPDFIIIRSDPQTGYVIDILEPHNPDFKDNLGKAKGLAKYAKDEPRIGRVQLIRTGKDASGKIRFKRLDLAKGNIGKKVLSAMTTDELDYIFDTDGMFAS